MTRILTVVGARPQFIKATAVGRAIATARADGRTVEEVLVHTGQHYDPEMSGDIFTELALPTPRFQLDIGSDTPTRQVARMMTALEPVVVAEAPDVVLLYGDTNSTIAGALTAAKVGVPSAHVEAGLRSFRRDMPEEVNRVVTDHLAALHFAPSGSAAQQLRDEGITDGVHIVGDVMHDVMRWRRADGRHDPEVLSAYAVEADSYLFVTVHRQATTDDPRRLAGVADALARLGPELHVLFSVHPRTRPLLPAWLGDVGGVTLLPPLPYGDTLALVANASVVLTDSGGLQKEAFWSATPCVTLRDETEWVETVAEGWNRVVGTDPAAIVEAAVAPRPEEPPSDVYGVGDASGRIVDALLAHPWRA